LEAVKNPDAFGRGQGLFELFEGGKFGFDHVIGYWGAGRMISESSPPLYAGASGVKF